MPKTLPPCSQRFGLWTVLGEGPDYISPKGARQTRWLCVCDCGTQRAVPGTDLKNGKSRGCGCTRGNGIARHGHNRRTGDSPTYRSWCGMKTRCNNPNIAKFGDYGGRGITMYPRWESFDCFLADMGERPPGCSLDRIDVDKGYGPDNCRWADYKTQARNTRRTVLVTYQGRRMPRAEAVELSGIGLSTLRTRVKNGWPESEWFRPIRGSQGRAERRQG